MSKYGSGKLARSQRRSNESGAMDDQVPGAAGQGSGGSWTPDQEISPGGGNFKNNGTEWQAKGEKTEVNVYDFLSLASGKAIPYGVYDLVHNQGFVNVGLDHDPAEFAVESIRQWWQLLGRRLYPEKKELLITADGGGSNGVRNRLWKKQLQELANEEQLSITVAHYPPATSKWNKIEHRLFSFISINWCAKPLTSLEVVLELISHTTTNEGLTVRAIRLDARSLMTNWLPSICPGILSMANGTIRSSLKVLDHLRRGHPRRMLPRAICLRVNICILEACLLSFSLSLCLLEETPASKLGVDAGEPENDGTK